MIEKGPHLIFTKHAQQRMKERGVSRKEVGAVIFNPDKINRENGRVIASRRINEEILEVIYVAENNKRIILTCYYLR